MGAHCFFTAKVSNKAVPLKKENEIAVKRACLNCLCLQKNGQAFTVK